MLLGRVPAVQHEQSVLFGSRTRTKREGMAPRLDTPALHRPRGDTGPPVLDSCYKFVWLRFAPFLLGLKADGYEADDEDEGYESDEYESDWG